METRSDSPRWLIDFQCPRCAGNVSLEETERIFTCAWCRVKLCLGSRGPLECYIPAPPGPGENALYVPYWRLKGMAFTCTAGSIQSGAVDLSHIALTAKTLPWSLGIQTQLARLRFLAPGVAGTFFAPTLTIGEAIAGCEANLKQLGIPPWTETALHRAWIGEQTSLLYYPLARRDGQIVDALQDRIFESVGQWEARAPAAKQPDFQVRFYAATCPDCGVDLDGDRDTLVLTCRNCDRAWKRGSEGLEEMPFLRHPGSKRRGAVRPALLAHPGGRGGNIACVLCGLRPFLQPAPGNHAGDGGDPFLFLGACLQGQRGPLSDPDSPGDALPVAGGVRAAPGHSQMPPGDPACRGERRKPQDGPGRPRRRQEDPAAQTGGYGRLR